MNSKSRGLYAHESSILSSGTRKMRGLASVILLSLFLVVLKEGILREMLIILDFTIMLFNSLFVQFVNCA